MWKDFLLYRLMYEAIRTGAWIVGIPVLVLLALILNAFIDLTIIWSFEAVCFGGIGLAVIVLWLAVIGKANSE